MRNIHDWCVSRQLWWGHQIPAWYCEYGHVTVARETPRECETCHSGRLTQDPDVLDTWFSSGLWPFSTLGWPDETTALKTFYPNSVLETGFDIIFFWVARMAMLGLHFMGDVPFHVVFLHAMVRDKNGEKMSKTRGNVIDPLDITAKYGADALRFTLASMAGQGRDIKLDEKRIEGYRAFANKIWNAARFVLRSADGYDPDHPAPPASVYDRWILSCYQRCAEETQNALEEFRLNDAANGIYRFVWGELCDWAIELSKPALYGDRTPSERAGAQSALLQSLEGEVHLPLAGLIDFAAEKARVEKELEKLEGELAGIAKRLENPGFLARAPAEVVDKDRARAAELQERRDKLTRHRERVTRAEDGMNEQMSGGNNGGDGEEKPGQGHRGADQMGTHGGPSRSGNGGRGEGPHSDPQAPGRPAGGTGSHGGGPSEKHETSGHPGSSSEAEAEKEEPSPGEREGMAAQAASRVKSLARGLMEKAADVVQTGLQTAEEKLDEMAKAAPKIQERFARQKASKVTR